MRKLVTGFAVFGLAALVAAYVALAPLAASGPGALESPLAVLDEGAARLSEAGGLSAVVLAVLGAGMALGMIAGFFVGAGSGEEGDMMPAPGPVWRPEPHPGEHRAAGGLRRRAGAEEQPAFFEAPADAGEEAASLETPARERPPRPVILVRKERRGEDWTGSTSWLGGLPRLADSDWPCDAAGLPLPFAAQIDLAELAASCPESPLPREGSLAFFLGSGAVVAVRPGDHEFTEPPAGLPPAYTEGSGPLPAERSRLSRDLFPFWPVEPVALPLPDALLDHRDRQLHEQIEKAMSDMVRERFGKLSSRAPICSNGELWWYGVIHLADRLREAMDNAPLVLGMKAQVERTAEEALAALETRDDALPEAVAGARRKAHEAGARRHEVEQEAAELPAMIDALEGFVANREPWEPLTAEERNLVVEILDEVHRRYGTLVRSDAPLSLAELQALCIRAMVTDGPEALAALPDDVLERIAKEHRLPTPFQHQVFGLAGMHHSARGEHLEDLLLLQLGYDDMMEWRWGNQGLVQFWISPDAAAAGRWDKAGMTFETS